MAEKQDSTGVAVIGAGPGGYAAAFMAADLGQTTTLIDPEANPGGVCLYRGCIPTKALLHACHVVGEARRASAMGVNLGKARIDIDKLRGWKEGVVGKLTKGLGQLGKARSVTYLRGRAAFKDPHTLEVTSDDGSKRPLSFEHAVVATGARAVPLGDLSFESPAVLNSAQALEIESVPKRLLVIGGGYIGLELGTIYATLGTEVTVVEMMPGLMPGADRDLVDTYVKATRGVFKQVLLNTTAEVRERDGGVKATFKGPDAPGGEQDFDKVLLTVGRKPLLDNLGLDNTAVEVDSKGYIKTDSQKRTAESSVFAVGDVAGPPLLAHKATHEGRTAAEVIAGRKVAFEPGAIPAVEYTDPEIAWCGLTETEAAEQGREIKSVSFPWGASGRAATIGRKQGVTKLIVDPETERILGAGIVGAHAGELISEAALAVEMDATVRDLSLTIHPHPTLSETVMGAAELYYGTATDFRKRKS